MPCQPLWAYLMGGTGFAIPLLVGLGLFLLIIIAVWMNAPRTGSKANSPAGDDFPELDFLGHLREGNTFSTTGDWQKALRHFKAAAALRPGEPSLHFKMGRVHGQLEDWSGAITAFRTALSLNPELLDAHYELARIAYRQEDYQSAKGYVADALALDPQNEPCLKLQLKILEKLEDGQGKLSVLAKLTQISRDPKKYRAAWADTATELGLYEEALQEYQSLLAQFPDEAIEYQDKIGHLYLEQSQFESAIVLLRQAWYALDAKAPVTLDLDGNPIQQSPQIVAEKALISERLSLALCLQAEKILENLEENPEPKKAEDAAIASFAEALRYDANSADIHCRMGVLHLNQGDKSKALEAFQEALIHNSYATVALVESARIEEDRSHYEEATTFYERYLAIEGQDGSIHFALGTLYGIQEQVDLSITHLKTAIALDPLFVEAHYNLAVALEQKHDYKAATQSYKKVLQLDPTHEKAKSNLAYLRHDGRGA